MRQELIDSGIIFNETEHTYYDPTIGKYLSGITEALHHQLAEDEFSNVSQKVMDEATLRGKQCHSSIEKFTTQWIDDGSKAVASFQRLCREHNLCSEAAEYNVTDHIAWSSNIDCVFREDPDLNVFSLADIKTFAKLDSTKYLKVCYQLGIYAWLFELTNAPIKATVKHLYVIHIRETDKESISELIEIPRLPIEACKEILQCELEGRKFTNDPLAIPPDVAAREEMIRDLLNQKADIENQIQEFKNEVFQRMMAIQARQWNSGTMKLSIKAGSQRSTFNVKQYQADNPELDLTPYYKTTEIGPSLLVTI